MCMHVYTCVKQIARSYPLSLQFSGSWMGPICITDKVILLVQGPQIESEIPNDSENPDGKMSGR